MNVDKKARPTENLVGLLPQSGHRTENTSICRVSALGLSSSSKANDPVGPRPVSYSALFSEGFKSVSGFHRGLECGETDKWDLLMR